MNFQCISKFSTNFDITEESVMNEYKTYANITDPTYGLVKFASDIHKNFTVYLMSFGSMLISSQSKIIGARVGLCADNIKIESEA